MEPTNTHLFLSNPETLTDASTNTLLLFQLSKLVTNLTCLYVLQWWWTCFDFFPLLTPPTVALWKWPCKRPSPSSLPFCSSFLLPLLTILRLLCVAVAVCYRRAAVGDGLAALLLWGGFASVSVVVEIGEEDDESDGVANQSPLHPGGERTAGVEGVSSVADGYMELDLEMYTHVLANNAMKFTLIHFVFFVASV